MISSFGVLIIITHMTAMVWGSNPWCCRAAGRATVYRLGPIYTTDAQLLIIGFAAALAIALYIFFRHMRLGIAIRALGNDSELGRESSACRQAAAPHQLHRRLGSRRRQRDADRLNVGIIDFNMGTRSS